MKELTVDEMREKIEEYCINKKSCYANDKILKCPLYYYEENCYCEASDAIIKRNYNILFGSRGKRASLHVIDEVIPTPKNKHPFNSTEIITIKRKKNKLFLRYTDENGKVFKTSASCHKDDEFDIVEGIKVLTDKLDIKKNGREPFTFVALCDSYQITKGKIYRTNKDNAIVYDNNSTGYSYKNFEDFASKNKIIAKYILQIKED